MSNAKNTLHEVLQALGARPETSIECTHMAMGESGGWHSSVVATFPDGSRFTGQGEGGRRSSADFAAAGEIMGVLRESRGDLLVNWEKIFADAQPGDALIKLSAYLASGLDDKHERSNLLQKKERDVYLATVVWDRWRAQGAPEMGRFGDHLGEKNKASLVEAILWWRYKDRVMKDGAVDALAELMAGL